MQQHSAGGTCELSPCRHRCCPLHLSGDLDTTFGSPDGYVLTQIGSSPYPYGLAIDGDGKIVVAGGQGSGTSAYFVARYLP